MFVHHIHSWCPDIRRCCWIPWNGNHAASWSSEYRRQFSSRCPRLGVSRPKSASSLGRWLQLLAVSLYSLSLANACPVFCQISSSKTLIGSNSRQPHLTDSPSQTLVQLLMLWHQKFKKYIWEIQSRPGYPLTSSDRDRNWGFSK